MDEVDIDGDGMFCISSYYIYDHLLEMKSNYKLTLHKLTTPLI